MGIDGLESVAITEALSWRHHLHRNPELAYNERNTADFVATILTNEGLAVHKGLAGTGVVGTLKRGTSRRTIAIRADMDALPILERSGVPHASRDEGAMHACGHDGHVAMALAAARICARQPDLDGTVHFIFQPAEEGGAGARRMIDEGLFKLFPCDFVFALHNWPALPVGTCAVLNGAMMAANAVFEIVLSGRGCHGAMPHEGTDPIVAGCQLVSSLQSIVSRNVSPLETAVVSITQIHAGHAHNVIPDKCSIRGTTRWLDGRVGDRIERRLLEMANSTATSFGCEAHTIYERRYPATINDAAAAGFVRDIARGVAGLTVADSGPSMASEDFSFMLQSVPGAYLWLGSGRSDSNPGLHSSSFDFNDDALPLGIDLWVSLVRKSLSC